VQFFTNEKITFSEFMKKITFLDTYNDLFLKELPPYLESYLHSHSQTIEKRLF